MPAGFGYGGGKKPAGNPGGAGPLGKAGFKKRVEEQVNAPSTQQDLLKATGVAPAKKTGTTPSPEQKAGAQKQLKPKVKTAPKVKPRPKVQRAASLKAAGAARMGGHGLSAIPDAMQAAGYTPQNVQSFMQEEGRRLLQEGWERQNVGRFQPP